MFKSLNINNSFFNSNNMILIKYYSVWILATNNFFECSTYNASFRNEPFPVALFHPLRHLFHLCYTFQ